MTCKIKKALLVDTDFLTAISEIYSMPMSMEVSYKFFAMVQSLREAGESVEAERMEILNDNCIKNNNGSPKMKKGSLCFKHPKVVEDLVMSAITKEIEFDNRGIKAEDIAASGISPKHIQALAIVSQILEK